MKFTGQIRFPDIDHPGIPAAFHVEEKQAELMLEGESLGRWSLFDVQARRLVSAAFEVSLKGEEVTFIADQPMDFAYRGIEHMAEVWAGFKSRGFVSRLFAVKWSRRGTEPSRLGELQKAMLENLSMHSAPRRVSGLRSEPAPSAPTPAAPEPAAPTPEPPPEPVVSGRPPPATPLPDTRESDAVQAERAALEAERARIEADRQRLEAERVAAEREVADSIAAARAEIEKLEAKRAEAMEVTSPAVEEQEVPEPPAADPLAAEPELAGTAAAETQAAEPEPAEHEDPADLVAEFTPASAEAESEDQARELVVDLGELETTDAEPPGEPEPALAGAAPKSGLMGAVKAAFSKNSGRQHVHEFVEAPAGIGIVRSICSDCGYVSISTSD